MTASPTDRPLPPPRRSFAGLVAGRLNVLADVMFGGRNRREGAHAEGPVRPTFVPAAWPHEPEAHEGE